MTDSRVPPDGGDENSRGADDSNSKVPVSSDLAFFGLSSEAGKAQAEFLADLLKGYTNWFLKNGVFYHWGGVVLQTSATLFGLIATILASAPNKYQDYSILDIRWKWAIAICTAITTVLSGALPSVLRLARDREDGRIEMFRLKQELDLLTASPTVDVYVSGKAVIDRIATIERSYGGSVHNKI